MHRPLTAAITGLRDSRIESNGTAPVPSSSPMLTSPSSCWPPSSPPGAKTSPVPVTTSACSERDALTRSTARRIPKYMFEVSAFRRSGRSMVTHAVAPRSSQRRNREPRSTSLVMPLVSLPEWSGSTRTATSSTTTRSPSTGNCATTRPATTTTTSGSGRFRATTTSSPRCTIPTRSARASASRSKRATRCR